MRYMKKPKRGENKCIECMQYKKEPLIKLFNSCFKWSDGRMNHFSYNICQSCLENALELIKKDD